MIVANKGQNVYEATSIYPDYMFYLEHFKSVEAVQRIWAEWERASPNILIHSMSSQHSIMLEKKITFKPVSKNCLLMFVDFFHHIKWFFSYVSIHRHSRCKHHHAYKYKILKPCFVRFKCVKTYNSFSSERSCWSYWSQPENQTVQLIFFSLYIN